MNDVMNVLFSLLALLQISPDAPSSHRRLSLSRAQCRASGSCSVGRPAAAERLRLPEIFVLLLVLSANLAYIRNRLRYASFFADVGSERWIRDVLHLMPGVASLAMLAIVLGVMVRLLTGTMAPMSRRERVAT